MKKLKLSIKSKFNMFLITTALPFVVVAMVFTFLLNKNREYELYGEKINSLKMEYLSMKQQEQSFLLNYPSDNTFFKTGDNDYLRRFDILSRDLNKHFDEVLNINTTQKLNIGDKIYMLKENAGSYADLLNTIANKAYQRGSVSTGIIGELERSYANAVTQNSLPAKSLAALKDAEVQYLYRKDSKFYNDFIALYSQYMGSAPGGMGKDDVDLTINVGNTSSNDSTESHVVTPIPMVTSQNSDKAKPINDFKRYFTSLVKIDREIGFSSEEGLLAELEVEKGKLDDIDSVIKQINDARIQNENRTRTIFIWVAILLTIAILFGIRKISKNIEKSIFKLKQFVEPLSQGILPEERFVYESNDELAEMGEELNTFAEGLKKTTQFASSIGGGNLDTEFTPLSEHDVLGNSLLEMRSNLYKSQQEAEKRKNEDDLRKWANEGLTQFSEILRQSTNSMSDLANNVIKSLIHFLGANQGGIFLLNDSNKNDVYLELVSSYAYNQERKKKKKIYPGEGLIGTCAIEKSYVYLTDLPNDYLTITSGLGGANPSCLLIMPLKVEEQIFGAMEIASFKKMERHEIDFVEKVSESIASTLSIAKINQRTAELLTQSQQQAEEMASQEEEMRQNLEELQATQEESARKEAEMQSILNAVNSSSLVIEFDLNGRITSVNEAVSKTLNLQRENIIGRNLSDFRDPEDPEPEDPDFWNRVREGEVVKRTDKIVASGEAHWLHQVYTPILDSDGFPYKILNMATDISANKRLEIELTDQAEKMAAQEEEMRQNLEELQATQETMAKQQDELNNANKKLHDNEGILMKAIEKSRQQEQSLQEKVKELNKLHKEIELQKTEIMDQNRELQEKERFQAKALQDADRNMERARVKIMAEFVRNLERHTAEMDAAEKLLKKNRENIPPEVFNTIHDLNSEFRVMISKYKLD